MRMEQHPPFARIIFALCCLFVCCMPAFAADTGISRSVDPVMTDPGGTVTVTIHLPSSFTGVVVENLPAGYSFAGTTHPSNGFRQEGTACIFAVIGEETIQYTLHAPESGCGVLHGQWENVGLGTKGQVPAAVLSVEGSDPSRCSAALPAHGFSLIGALLAAGIASILLTREGRQ